MLYNLYNLYSLYSFIWPVDKRASEQHSGMASAPKGASPLRPLQPPGEDDEEFSMKVVFAQSATQWIFGAQVATLHSLYGLYSLYSLTRPVGKRTS